MNHMARRFAHQNQDSMQCTTESGFTGTCRECKKLHGKECRANVKPDVDINRDDIMTTGFIPDKFTSPITLKFTKIAGADIQPDTALTCPPRGWKPQGPASKSWTPPKNMDLFVDLTVADGGNDGAADGRQGAMMESTRSMARAVSTGMFMMVGLGMCCCFACILAGAASAMKMGAGAGGRPPTIYQEQATYAQQPVQYGAQATYGTAPGAQATYGVTQGYATAPAPGAGATYASAPGQQYVPGQPM